jgi:hypothetical protein
MIMKSPNVMSSKLSGWKPLLYGDSTILQNGDLWQPNPASSSVWVADSSLLKARSESSSEK